MNAPVGWRPVRTGMILIGVGMFVLAGAQLLLELLMTSELAKLRGSGLEDAEKIFERIELLQKVFPLFLCSGLVLVLVGAACLMRTPPPSATMLLALLGLLACVFVLLIEGFAWVLLLGEAKFLDKIYDIKALWVIDVVLTAAMVCTLAFAMFTAMRGAGQGGALALVIITCVLAVLVMLWLGYFIVARPRWRMAMESPWLWMLLTDMPRIARDVLLGTLALVGAGQIRQARA